MARKNKGSNHYHPKADADVAAEIGPRVRSRREELCIWQEKLAHSIGLHYSTVSHIERSDRSLRVISILRLAEGLGRDPGELLSGIAAPPREGR